MVDNRKLTLVLYRSLLRWSRANVDVPFSLRSNDIKCFAPEYFSGNERNSSPLSWIRAGESVSTSKGATQLAEITRFTFNNNKILGATQSQQAINRGLEALRSLNTFYAAILEEARAARADHVDRTGIKYHVGQTFIHKKYGYKGVIYGWDRTCQRDAQWIQQMQANPNTPHYLVLPDESDCVRLFGGVRLTKYVGEDNMEPLEGAHRIVHRALDHYFEGQAKNGAYIPCLALRYEYPEDGIWENKDSQGDSLWRPASEDANLLENEDSNIEKAENQCETSKTMTNSFHLQAEKEREH